MSSDGWASAWMRAFEERYVRPDATDALRWCVSSSKLSRALYRELDADERRVSWCSLTGELVSDRESSSVFSISWNIAAPQSPTADRMRGFSAVTVMALAMSRVHFGRKTNPNRPAVGS